MPETCLIITGGPSCYIPEGRAGADFVIACDYGYVYALQDGIVPDLVLGDFDSYKGTLADALHVQRVPSEKDDTDTMLAVREALDRGYRRIVIVGALGGRIDHELANLTACVFAAERGARCYLVDEHHQIFAIHNTSCRIARSRWSNLSVFASGGKAEGVTLNGLKYPLTDAVLHSSVPLGVSNRFVAEQAEITVREGTLLIVLTDME